MSGWPNYPGPMDYGQGEQSDKAEQPEESEQFRPNMGIESFNGPHNEEQPLIDYLETRYDNDPRYNDPTDPDTAEDFEPEYDDEGNEV